jgi:tetratricopeptide (TPR) repeat protein
MEIIKKLNQEKVSRLKTLARQLKLTGYSKLNKQPLIDFIIANSSPEKITTALNFKVPLLKRIKDYTHFYGVQTSLGVFPAFLAIILSVYFFQSSKESSINLEKALDNISQKMDKVAPVEREQLMRKIKDLETSLNKEKTGDTKERREALKALEMGDLSKAQTLFEELREKEREKEKQNAKTAYNLGNAYYLDIKYKKALSAYLESERLDPGNALYLNNIGYFEKALEIIIKNPP